MSKLNQEEIAEVRQMLAKRLIALRKGKGLTVAELSKIIGVLPKTILNWESGKSRMRIRYLPRLAKFYKVSVNYLLCLED